MTELRVKLNTLDTQNLENSDLLYNVLEEIIIELEILQSKLKIIESKLDLK